MSTEVDPETNPFGSGVDNPGADEDIEIPSMTSSRRGSVDPTSLHKAYEETSFCGHISDTTPLITTSSLVEERRENVDTAWDRIQRKFPNANTTNSTFTAKVGEGGHVLVRLIRGNAKYHPLFKLNSELNDKLPQKIVDSLGQSAEEIVETNEEEIARRSKKVKESQEQLEKTAEEHMREGLNQTIDEEMDIIAQLERANEEIEQRMTLRDRVKAIFRKYGFTVLAVASAVGVVICVIVANLKNGLNPLAKE